MVNWFLTKVPRQFSGERIVVWINVLGQLAVHMQKTKSDLDLTPYAKNELKVDHRLKCKNWNYKTIRKSAAENAQDFWLGKEFIDKTPKAWSKKKKVYKVEFIKIKNIVLQKIPLRTWKDNPQTGRKYLQIIQLIKDLFQII